MKRMKLLFTLALPVLLCQNIQAQTSSRLTAQAHWNHNGVMFMPTDSSTYVYSSNQRGGDLTHTLKYDNSTLWNYNNDSARYLNFQYYTQEFDANNNITMNTLQEWDMLTSAWVPLSRVLYTYTSANMMATQIWQTWGGASWLPVSKDVYTYDGTNQLILDQYQTWNGLTMVFDPYSQKTYSYDAITHKLLNETDQDVFSGTPTYTGQYVYTYTAGNQLMTKAFSTWNSGWVNSDMYTYAYDSSGNRITQLYQIYDVPTSAWVNVTYNLYGNFNSSHLPQSEIDQSWNSTGSGLWVNFIQFTYTYNSYGQMTSSVGQSWNVVGIFEYATGDPMVRNYYSTYSPAAVKEVVSTNGTANIFPVPASDLLHIDLKWNVAQSSAIAIYDMAGRMVTPLINVPSGSEYHTSLSVGNLAAGMYVVKINGANGQIVKQIVVAK
jgi:hypothetical protein